jgi:hypothetical protein
MVASNALPLNQEQVFYVLDVIRMAKILAQQFDMSPHSIHPEEYNLLKNEQYKIVSKIGLLKRELKNLKNFLSDSDFKPLIKELDLDSDYLISLLEQDMKKTIQQKESNSLDRNAFLEKAKKFSKFYQLANSLTLALANLVQTGSILNFEFGKYIFNSGIVLDTFLIIYLKEDESLQTSIPLGFTDISTYTIENEKEVSHIPAADLNFSEVEKQEISIELMRSLLSFSNEKEYDLDFLIELYQTFLDEVRN